MEKVRFGLIGIGAQGGAYAGFLTGQGGFPGMPAPQCPPHCALGALCDIDPEKEKMCREKYPDVPFFKDWKEMVASGTVDAVITTVPHYLHHEIAIYCLEHGMNVLVEKPAGVRAKDVMAMNKCAEEHPDVAFGIMFNQRTNKLYQKIKEIVASGELCEDARLPGTKFYYGASHAKLIGKFYKALEDGTDGYIHVRDAEMSIRLIDAAQEAGRTGGSVAL